MWKQWKCRGGSPEGCAVWVTVEAQRGRGPTAHVCKGLIQSLTNTQWFIVTGN